MNIAEKQSLTFIGIAQRDKIMGVFTDTALRSSADVALATGFDTKTARNQCEYLHKTGYLRKEKNKDNLTLYRSALIETECERLMRSPWR